MKYKLLILLILCVTVTTGWSQVSSALELSSNKNVSTIVANSQDNLKPDLGNFASEHSLQVQAFCYDSLNLVRINWKGPAGFKKYDVYRNGEIIAENIKTPFYVDSTVAPAAYYHYSFSAKNEKDIFSSAVSPDVFTSPCLAVTAVANPFQITVSPNPSPAVFYFSASNLRNKILNIQVLNSAGTIFFQQQTKSMAADFIQTIDLSNAAPGVYFMKIQIDRNIYFKQLVKQ